MVAYGDYLVVMGDNEEGNGNKFDYRNHIHYLNFKAGSPSWQTATLKEPSESFILALISFCKAWSQVVVFSAKNSYS